MKKEGLLKKIIIIVLMAIIIFSTQIVIAYFSYEAGYTVGSIETKNAKYETIIGIYIAEDPKYGSMALIINGDGTCNHPFGMRGTWTQDSDTITFVFGDVTQQGSFDFQTCTIYYENRLYLKIS